MRYRRLSFVAGWIGVALLAMVGFAAFRNPSPSSLDVRVEAAAASMGHTSGAYAGLAFAVLGPEVDNPVNDLIVAETIADPTPQSLEAATARETENVPEVTTENDSAGGWLSQVEVRAYVSLYFEPADVNQAVRVAWCESRFNPEAVSRKSGGVGLFQHLPRYWEDRAANAGFAGADPTDPEASTAAAAWAVYHGGGWDIFTCRG